MSCRSSVSASRNWSPSEVRMSNVVRRPTVSTKLRKPGSLCCRKTYMSKRGDNRCAARPLPSTHCLDWSLGPLLKFRLRKYFHPPSMESKSNRSRTRFPILRLSSSLNIMQTTRSRLVLNTIGKLPQAKPRDAMDGGSPELLTPKRVWGVWRNPS